LLISENNTIVEQVFSSLNNIYGGHTLIPFIEKISTKFNLKKPIVVADAGLLSNENIKGLQEKGYEYILGSRLKNEPDRIKRQILENQFA